MQAPYTNHAISACHLANFKAEAKKAASESELKRIAEKHALYFVKKDADEARRVYAQYARRIRGAA
ncbi:MAG: hypothetical protein LBQ62_09970 [Candidatus Accumulibacter sp.]|jgi:hypothetical protein|nr:hypothetical protein [Accumulibacter sp.]